MTTIAAARPKPDVARPVSREPAWWGMLLFVTTEAAVFLVLLAAYFYVRVHATGGWPPAGEEKPKLLIPSIMTGLLMISSVPAYWAERSAKRGRQGSLKLALAATFVLGAAFLGLQAWEYSDSLGRMSPHDSAYASLFYTIAGVHGAHVAGGLVVLIWTFVMALAGKFTPARNLAVQNVALYWHFVHGVWLAIFGSLYLSVSL